jgi:hypothetical protein
MKHGSAFTMMTVGVIGFCTSSIARADKVPKFRMFLHATSIQSQEVGDVVGMRYMWATLPVSLRFLMDRSARETSLPQPITSRVPVRFRDTSA